MARGLGAHHPATLTVRANLALQLGEAGRPEEAVGLCGEVLRDRMRVLRRDHPDTLTVWVTLGQFIGQTGRLQEAIQLYGDLIPHHPRVLGADHPQALTARSNMLPLRVMDFKSFLRLHFDADGNLTVFPIGIDRVCRRWRLSENGPPEGPWLEPDDDGVEAHLIEQPVRIGH